MKAEIKHRTHRLQAETESERVSKLGRRLWFAGFIVVSVLILALDPEGMSRQQLWQLFMVIAATAAGLHYALRPLIFSKLHRYKEQEYQSWCELRELRAPERGDTPGRPGFMLHVRL